MTAAMAVFLLPLATGIGGGFVAGQWLAEPSVGSLGRWQAGGMVGGLALGVFLANHDCQLAIGQNGTSQPCRISAIENPEYLADQPAIAKEALIEQAKHGEFYPIFKGWREWFTEYRAGLDPLFSCEGTPEEILPELDTILTEIIQRYNA